MKYISLLLALFVIYAATAQSESDIGRLFEQQQKESLEFNATVTDQEIIEFFEFQYENDPQMLEQFRQLIQTPETKDTYFSNYRSSHNEGGIKIPTLRGMSEKELSQLREIFKYKKREYYEAEDAVKRLEQLSNEELTVILQEGVKLAENYSALKQEGYKRFVRITDNFPSKLEFLNLRFIYIGEKYCRLFLQKGIGKGVGLSVNEENGKWVLSTFNEYKSWERKKVTLQ
ncbi:MAG: hypothetical protein ABW092_14375 [Candidatus Thiodiazotropha sp.]